MKRWRSVLLGVGGLVLIGGVVAQTAAPARPGGRYDVRALTVEDKPSLGILDRQSGTLFIYQKRPNRFFELEGTLDLSKAGEQVIEYRHPNPK